MLFDVTYGLYQDVLYLRNVVSIRGTGGNAVSFMSTEFYPKPGNKCVKDEYKFIYASKLSMDFLSFFFTKFTRSKIFRIFPLSFFEKLK